jgi:hypothetical protein
LPILWALALVSLALVPTLRSIRVEGAEAYNDEEVLQIIRLHPGDVLRRDAQAVAGTLEARYRLDGYLAARVKGSFDPESGELDLVVDEGRLEEIAIDGVSGKVGARALQELDLDTGEPLREDDVENALDHLRKVSGGSLVPAIPPYTVAETPLGARLELHLTSPLLGHKWVFWGPASTAPVNPVDGFAPWLGGRLVVNDPASYNQLVLYASGSYGFSSQKTRFIVGARRPFGAGERLTLGYEFHDLTDTDDVFRMPAFNESLGVFLFGHNRWDFYARRGQEGYLVAPLRGDVEMGLTFRSDTYRSVLNHADFSVFHRGEPLRESPRVNEGLMRSALLSVGWSSRDPSSFGPSAFPLRDLYGARLSRRPGVRIHMSLEVASKSAFGGEFSFRRFVGNFLASRRVLPGESLSGRVLVGLTGGTPPTQKLFALGGQGTLPAFDFKEFSGGNMALMSLEWLHVVRFPFPCLIAFFDSGGTWGPGPPSGVRSDAGLALEWGNTEGLFIRLDFAFAVSSRRPPNGISFRGP